jgi:nickel-dependent lactate racemase
MRYTFRYGDGCLSMDIQEPVIQEILPKSVIKFQNDEHAIRSVLESPHSSINFRDLVSPDANYTIIVEDPSTCKNIPIMLGSILSVLRSKAVDSENISIIASINNSQNTDIEKMSIELGNLNEESYPFYVHNIESSSNLDYLGNTPTYNTPIFVNEIFTRADFRIGIGDICPDMFLGATGGRTAIIPGICGYKTVEKNHELTLQGDIGPFKIINPVNIDMIETSNIANLQYILNEIPDWNGTIAEYVSGSSIEAWQRGVRISRSLATRVIDQRTDIVFVSAGGAPKDRTLFDAVNSLFSASLVTRRDGIIVLIAECNQGLGIDGFRESLFNSESEEDVLEQSQFNFKLGMEKAWYFRKLLASRKVIICSRLRESMVNERLQCDGVKDPQEGLELARQYTGLDSKISIIPNGHSVMPIFG